MNNCVDIIKQRQDEYIILSTEINNALTDIVTELKSSPINLMTALDKIDEPELSWKIDIENKIVILTCTEIIVNYVLGKMSESNLTYKKCLTKLILEKFIYK